MSAPMILFFKAEQLGLFDAPVNVRASVRKDGTVVKPHTRIQKKRAEPPKKSRPTPTGDLFAAPKRAFQPTHVLSDGTEVVAGDEPDLWLDAEGAEIEDTEAVPIGTKGREEKLREREPTRVESDAWQRFGAGPIEGLELRHQDGHSWVLILADASEPGKYRYQIFDKDGTQAHESFPSLREALEGAWAAGYRERDTGAMDRVVREKRLAPEPDPQFDRALTKQAAKLRGRGEGIIARAEAELGRDRQMNTPRRARIGYGAMQQAQREKAFGETLIRIADAMEAGSVSRLSRLSNAKQLEALDGELRRARHVGLSYSEQKGMEGKPYGPEDAAKAQFPVIQFHGHMAHSVANDLAKLKGGKALADWLRAKAGRIGRDEQFEIPFEKAVAIVKLDPKAHWYLTDRVGEIKRLAALGIENTQDMRAALAELVTLRSGVQGIDPIKKAEMALIGTKIPGYFPTPKGIVEQMIAVAGIQPGMAVLEPSAGKGDIADMIRHAGVDPDVIEINSTLRDILEAKGHRVIGHDFLELEDGERYDAIVMNPPFENLQDAEHVKRAYALLKPGGTLVSIMSPAAFFRTDRKAQAFREWMEGLDGAAVEKLPEGSFLQSDRSTGVSTRLFVVTKPERKEQAPEILHAVNNAQDGVTAKVVATPDGRYSVTLWDDDAGAAVGVAHIVPDLERAKAEAQRISGVQAGPKEGDTKVEDGVSYVLRDGRWHRQTPEPEPGVEYPTEKVEQAYASTSRRPSIAAALHKRWFDEAVQEQIAAAQEHVKTPEQERAMAVAVEAFKRDYIDKQAHSLALRAVTVSSHIAGKSNFNAKQASKRGRAMERAEAGFVQWLKGQEGRVRRSVLAARTNEQKAADTAAAAAEKEAKATKRTADLRRIMESLVGFKPGQELQIAKRAVTKVTRGNDGYPVSFVVDDPELTDNKFNIADVLFNGDRAAMRAMVDAIRAEAEATPTVQALEIQEDAFADLLREAASSEEGIPYFTEPERTVRTEDRAKTAGTVPVAEAQARLGQWKARAREQGRSGVNTNRVVLSLFDVSGEWSHPWLEAGYQVHRFDILDGQDINDFSVEHLMERLGIDHADVILAAPPCTDFSSSGAHAWKKKDADGRTEASRELVRQTLRTVELFRPSVWAMENPVGRIAKETGLPKPLMTFQPNNFGDPYTKRTLLWGDFRTDLPLAPVEATEGSKITGKLSGSDKYRRSLTPEGFAYAFFAGNNLEDMGVAGRLAQEFKGFPIDELQAAVSAGMAEYDIRSAIEDAYYDQDLDGARKALQRARPATPPEPKEGDTKTENGITYVLRNGRWHRETPEEKPEPKAAPPDDLNPNSPNYRYRDTGYIPGSRKEEAAGMLRRAGREGKQVRKNDVDWNELEANPREAEEVITKSNLFGSVDWEALKADGMEPAAGFLIDRIYASIAPKPADSTRQAREDYAVGLETIRDRLEACRTPDDVTQVLGQLLEENTGVILNAAEQAEVEPLQSMKRTLEKRIAELYREESELSTVHNQAIARVYVAEAEQAKRARRKWKPDPELDAELESARADQAAARGRLEAWREAHPEMTQQKFEERQPNGGVRAWFRSELDLARQALQVKIRAVEEKARARNIQENPMVRAWAQFGERFLNVLIYRRYKGSDAFAKHVARAKSGRITDWSWAEKGKISGKGAGKGAVRFQLQVASEFRREGGRVVNVNSTHALKARFNLRDVQSGNWVLKDPASAKFHVEHTAQAFADLAGLLGVEESDVSFNGRLAMAFGARGQGSAGWKDNAPRAHYEPIHRVINLTKMGGGGSLAHELFHAWDNIIREALGEGDVSAEYFATEMYQEIRDPAVREAFAGLERAMREGKHQFTQTHTYTESDYRLAQHNLGQGRSGFPAQIRDAGSLERALEVIAGTFTRDDRRTIKRRRDWTRIAVAWYGGNPEGGTIAAKTGPKMSTFEIEAMILDNGERGKYWSSKKEMAARAFQAWVEDRLRDRGQRNDYLSSGADNRWYPDANPYPEGAERERINAAFDVLMTTFRTQDILKKASAIFGARLGRVA